MSATPPFVQPGWRARLQLQFAHRHARTALVGKQHHGPMLVQRPFYPEGEVCHVYVLHPPGGVVGGDQIALNARVEQGAHALLTMPGATKFYRSAGATSGLDQHFDVQANATLEWLPQDNIFFPGARARINTHFHLAEGARLLAWEGLCLGRPVMQERFDHGAVTTRLAVNLAGRPLLHERLRIADGKLAKLGEHPLCATLLATPANEAALDLARDVLALYTICAGATLLDGLLVVRLLGHDNLQTQACLQHLWSALRPQVLGWEPCPPRIWAT